jgi:diacylglycerol kinase (ATP)
MKLFVILNPVAGKKKGEKVFQEAAILLEQKGIQFDLQISQFAGHILDIAAQMNPAHYDGVVVVGGDGTLFETVNGVLKKHGSFELPIGQIPVGTGNSFIRDLGIETVTDAVDKISAGRTRKIDVGFFKHLQGEHYFVNLLGTGFVADVARRAVKYKSLGPASYILGVFEQLVQLKSVPVEITIDGRSLQRDYMFAEICNSTKTGGNMIMAPEARIDDGILDVILLNKISRLNLLKIFPKIFNGTHILDSHVETFKGRHIILKPQQVQGLNADGEVMGQTPIEVSILPGKIIMFG